MEDSRLGHPWTEPEGELHIDEQLLSEFQTSLQEKGVKLDFFSGSWGTEFVSLVKDSIPPPPKTGDEASQEGNGMLVLGAETIYSPFALRSFAETLVGLLELNEDSKAFVGAKKVYFGVGGSMEDFCDAVRRGGAVVEEVREESDGVRRSVVEVVIEEKKGEGSLK
jgi:hypothetical protein